MIISYKIIRCALSSLPLAEMSAYSSCKSEQLIIHHIMLSCVHTTVLVEVTCTQASMFPCVGALGPGKSAVKCLYNAWLKPEVFFLNTRGNTWYGRSYKLLFEN